MSSIFARSAPALLAIVTACAPPPAADTAPLHPAQLVIPTPTKVIVGSAVWRIPDTLRIAAPDSATRWMAIRFGELSGRTVVPVANPDSASIAIDAGDDDSEESYRIAITSAGTTIIAPGQMGVRWAFETLRQLIPAGTDSLVAVTIDDAPRYPWRGAMLDVGRHTFPVADILRWIDLLARYKLNVFHWHLTEDQGWRIAIEKYPRLTAIGGYRTEADGSRYGGYFTQDQVREVVAYAAARGITVVPEIEMPGHSRAAIAAYPALSCTGETLPVPHTWGVFGDVLCPTESTFAFLEDVLTEVLALFPSRYIHIGGDEVPKERWRACAACQEIIRREQLADEHQLQRWFTARIGRWLEARGRVLIGWDEILDGGLPAGATVQAWQGSDRITAALAAGADVIASPSEWVYLNGSAASLPLSRVLQFDPAPATGDSGTGRLLGAEAPLWTEHVTSSANVELMWLPRLVGFAEAVWRGPTNESEFLARWNGGEAERVSADGYVIGPRDTDLVDLRVEYDSTIGAVRLHTITVPGVTVLARRDGDSVVHPVTSGRISLETPGVWWVGARFGEAMVREERRFERVEHLAVGMPVTFDVPPDARYPGTGSYTLTDGLLGLAVGDGLWNGWWGPNVTATIALDSAQVIHEVTVSLLEQVRSWVLLPREVRLALADDAGNWRDIASHSRTLPVTPDGQGRHQVVFALPAGTRATAVRLTVVNGGVLPSWHSGAGQPSWIFVDEILVR